MATEIVVTDNFRTWYESLTAEEQRAVRRPILLLQEQGTALSFPHSSAISGTTIALRELRVQHMGEPYRTLYVFDPNRQAVLLIGGNKVGQGNRWYKTAIRLAERLYAKYLEEIGGA